MTELKATYPFGNHQRKSNYQAEFIQSFKTNIDGKTIRFKEERNFMSRLIVIEVDERLT